MARDKRGLKVLYEDNHLIVINKPARILVHGDASGDTPLVDHVKSYIKKKYNKPGDVFLGVTHRLDRPVSGAIIFARTTKGLTRMQKLFADRKVQKTYWAISKKRPEPLQGHIKNYLYKDTAKNTAKALDKPSRRHPNAKLSELDYAMIGEVSGNHLIEVNPLTGRPHQIRVQLAGIGCTIVGDVKYGFPHRQWKGNINLHCRSMTFEHPVKKEMMTVTANPPQDDQIWRMFNEGGFW